jgi:hypothetical protein
VYIAVNKGSDVGVESLYTQQLTIHEQKPMRSKTCPDKTFCPRKMAINSLDKKIQNSNSRGMQ